MGFRSAGYHPGSADPTLSADTQIIRVCSEPQTQSRGQPQGLADWVSADLAKLVTGSCVRSMYGSATHQNPHKPSVSAAFQHKLQERTSMKTLGWK